MREGEEALARIPKAGPGAGLSSIAPLLDEGVLAIDTSEVWDTTKAPGRASSHLGAHAMKLIRRATNWTVFLALLIEALAWSSLERFLPGVFVLVLVGPVLQGRVRLPRLVSATLAVAAFVCRAPFSRRSGS